MKYLLDTCVISDFVKGHPQVMQKLKSMQPDTLGISSVTEMELRYGLKLNLQRANKIKPVIEALLDTIPILPYATGAATQTARIRAQLKQAGTPIGPYDAMIAGTAMQHQLIMVTSNVGEFSRIAGLEIEDWRDTA
jgi:tRNA(fMet)-specific endonuclease VapC